MPLQPTFSNTYSGLPEQSSVVSYLLDKHSAKGQMISTLEDRRRDGVGESSPQAIYLEGNQYSRITMIQKRIGKSQKKGIDKLLRCFQLRTTGIGFQYGVEGCKGIEAVVFRQPSVCTVRNRERHKKGRARHSAWLE